ncbi:MAG: hypothetical protein WC941_07560 [Candidatus Bathyarchaeia archaeon]
MKVGVNVFPHLAQVVAEAVVAEVAEELRPFIVVGYVVDDQGLQSASVDYV